MQRELQINVRASARHFVWPRGGFTADPPVRPLEGKQKDQLIKHLSHFMIEHFSKLFIPGWGNICFLCDARPTLHLARRRRRWCYRPKYKRQHFFLHHYYFNGDNGEQGRRLSASKDTLSKKSLSASKRELCKKKRKNNNIVLGFFFCTCWNVHAKSPESRTANWNHNGAFLDSFFFWTCSLAWKLLLSFGR